MCFLDHVFLRKQCESMSAKNCYHQNWAGERFNGAFSDQTNFEDTDDDRKIA